MTARSLPAVGRLTRPLCRPEVSRTRAWWEAFVAARGAVGNPAVDAISVAGQQHGLVILDANGEPIRDAKLWNDTESAADAEWLLDELGGPGAWAKACGVVPVAALTITKLSWLHRNEPGAFARIAHVMLPHDYLTYRLTGTYVTDRGDASGTGYFSARENTYRFDLLRIVERDFEWERVVPEVLGALDARPAAESPALVAAGTGDNMAAALGIALRPGDVVLSIGTSGTAYAVAEQAIADHTGAVACFADATGRFLPLACTLNATKVTDAIARLIGVDVGELDSLALDEPAGAGGVVLLPYFDGERTPNRPNATGAIAGLRSDVTREQLARAAFEGVVCGLLDAMDALDRAGVPLSGRLLLVGGGARSPAYRRIVADLSGLSVSVPVGDEHVAAGACVQAAAALTGRVPFQIVGDWALTDTTIIEPDPDVDREGIRDAYRQLRG